MVDFNYGSKCLDLLFVGTKIKKTVGLIEVPSIWALTKPYSRNDTGFGMRIVFFLLCWILEYVLASIHHFPYLFSILCVKFIFWIHLDFTILKELE